MLQAEHRLEQLKKATDRIQKEIEEVTEREHELRNVGSIKTTSHETVDSKVRLKLHVYIYIYTFMLTVFKVVERKKERVNGCSPYKNKMHRMTYDCS